MESGCPLHQEIMKTPKHCSGKTAKHCSGKTCESIFALDGESSCPPCFCGHQK